MIEAHYYRGPALHTNTDDLQTLEQKMVNAIRDLGTLEDDRYSIIDFDMLMMRVTAAVNHTREIYDDELIGIRDMRVFDVPGINEIEMGVGLVFVGREQSNDMLLISPVSLPWLSGDWSRVDVEY